MKTHILFGLTILTLFACADKVNVGVREIRQEVARIQSGLLSLQKTQRILLGFSTEGTAVTAFRENGDIRKITVEALGEMGKYLADFYFKNEHLIFSHVRLISYGGHIMEAPESKDLKHDVTEENQFYFDDGKLIRWLKFEELILPSESGYQAKGKSVLAEAQSFVLLMKTLPPAEGEDLCNWICSQKEGEYCVKYQCKQNLIAAVLKPIQRYENEEIELKSDSSFPKKGVRADRQPQPFGFEIFFKMHINVCLQVLSLKNLAKTIRKVLDSVRP